MEDLFGNLETGEIKIENVEMSEEETNKAIEEYEERKRISEIYGLNF